ncbi:acyltransferase [uncultured Arsenicicoccus sp.]|mgnify:CR=1 FL=1|uniref:acyltransferase family protein n=1 Tax=uncultured Arsenicicoccus sp. TaxID=491339 RepID=UPI00259A06E8|nr:acyltransferase [uncultured Arsenicicoccus sp.]
MAEPRTTRFAALDGLRIVGALMVVTTHVGFSSGLAIHGPYAGLLARLDAGVPLFFVVSGFLLWRPHVRARLGSATAEQTAGAADLRTYLRHRAFRILPAAWVAVLAAYLLLQHDRIGVVHYLRVATMSQIYVPSPSVPGLTQMWSLSTEVAFYLVLPLAAWGMARLPRTTWLTWSELALVVLACLPAVSLAWIVLTHDNVSGMTNYWLPEYLGWFGGGMALAVWHEGRLAGELPRTAVDDLVASPGTLWAAAGALYLLLTTRLAGPYGLDRATLLEASTKNLGYTVLAVLVVLPCIAAEPSSSRVVAALGSRPARLLGDLSYGVFVYHLVVLALVERAIGHKPFTGDFLVLWPLTVVGSVLVAWVSHRYLEEPIMRRARRRDPRRSRPPAVPTARVTATRDARRDQRDGSPPAAHEAAPAAHEAAPAAARSPQPQR